MTKQNIDAKTDIIDSNEEHPKLKNKMRSIAIALAVLVLAVFVIATLIKLFNMGEHEVQASGAPNSPCMYAVFDSSDNTLNFYFDRYGEDGILHVGGTNREIYDVTGFKKWTYLSNYAETIPWSGHASEITKVIFHETELDENDAKSVAPNNMNYWFYCLPNCTSIEGNQKTISYATSQALGMSFMFFCSSALKNIDLSGFDTSNVNDMSNMFSGCTALESLDVSSLDTSNVTNMSGMFAWSAPDVQLDVSNFDTSKVTTMSRMFQGRNQISYDLQNFDTSNVTNFGGMFSSNEILIHVNLSSFDTGKAQSFETMFSNCFAIEQIDVTGFDTSNAIDLSNMFDNCNNLKKVDVTAFNTSNVIYMTAMFRWCNSLPSIDVTHFDTSKTTSMISMFENCELFTEINVSNFNTAKVENMNSMFAGCIALQELDLSNFDTQNVKNMGSMFRGSCLIKELNLSNFKTPRLEDMSNIFSNMISLEKVDISNFDTSNVYTMNGAFACTALKNIDVSNFNTSNATDMCNMFSQTHVSYLDVSFFDTSNVVNMSCMFAYNEYLEDLVIENWDTSKVTDMTYMFMGCSKIKTLDLTSFTTQNVKNIDNIFNHCYSLETIYANDWDINSLSNTNLNLIRSYDTTLLTGGLGERSANHASNARIDRGINNSGLFTPKINIRFMDGEQDSPSGTAWPRVFNGENVFYHYGIEAPSNGDKYLVGWATCQGAVEPQFAIGDIITYNPNNIEDIILYPVYLGKQDIAFHANGGTFEAKGEMNIISGHFFDVFEYNLGDYVEPVKNDAIFLGWASTPSAAQPDVDDWTTFKGTRTLYAIWQDAFEITFNANGGTFENKSDTNSIVGYHFDSFETIRGEYLEPTKTDVRFMGWATTSNAYKPDVNNWAAIENEITLYAVWKDAIDVTFDATGGTFNDGNSETNIIHGYSSETFSAGKSRVSHTSNINDNGELESSLYGNNRNDLDVVTIPGASYLFVTITYQTESISYDWVSVFDGSTPAGKGSAYSSVSGLLGGQAMQTKTFKIQGDTVQFLFVSDGSNCGWYGYYAVVEGLVETEFDTLYGEYKEPTKDGYDFIGWATDTIISEPNVSDWQKIAESSTLYAIWREPIAFAVYSYDDYSLSLYKRGKIPEIGTVFDGKEVDEIFFDFEEDDGSSEYPPWNCYGVEEFIVVDEGISPYAIKNWFNCIPSSVKFDLAKLDTSRVADMSNLFYGCGGIQELDISSFDTSNVTDMSGMFEGCTNLVDLNLGTIDTCNVENMQRMFCECWMLESVDALFDTSNVTTMKSMFDNCMNISRIDVSNFDTSNVTDMSFMFYNCWGQLANLDLSNFNTQNVIDMSYMFSSCNALESVNVSSFNTENVENMECMFEGCSALESLDLSNFATSNVTSMLCMFSYNCTLKEIVFGDKFDTSNVEMMYNMFDCCCSLDELDLTTFDTSSVVDASGMFELCCELDTIYASSAFTIPDGCYGDYAFCCCESLIGGLGTVYDWFDNDVDYMRIDGVNETDGLFTPKINVEFRENDAVSLACVPYEYDLQASEVVDMSHVSDFAGWSKTNSIDEIHFLHDDVVTYDIEAPEEDITLYAFSQKVAEDSEPFALPITGEFGIYVIGAAVACGTLLLISAGITFALHNRRNRNENR